MVVINVKNRPFIIKHLYLKTIIYGAWLASIILLITCLVIMGASRATIEVLILAFFLAAMPFYFLSGHFFLWRRKAKTVDMVSDSRLFNIVEGLSKGLGIKTPHMAVIDRPAADAFIDGVARGHPILFITSGSLEEFNDEELASILEHELVSMDEWGSFVYNITVTALSAMRNALQRMGRAWLLRNAEYPEGGQGPPLTINRLMVSDVPAVVRLLISHHMYNYIFLHDLAGLATEQSPLLLVAHFNGKTVGFVSGQIDTGIGRWSMHFTKLIVDEDYRRKGIGNRLMQASIRMAESTGCDGFYLEVNVNNRNAISFYKKLGFKEMDLVRRYYPDGSDMLKMVKASGRSNIMPLLR
jgi:ribosomal protein S18 acetylase RimI-like enzyme